MSKRHIDSLKSLQVTINCLKQKLYRTEQWVRKRTATWGYYLMPRMNADKLRFRLENLIDRRDTLHIEMQSVQRYKEIVKMYMCNDMAGIVIEYMF